MAIGVAVGLCAMITLLPALLVIFGRWVFWPLRPTVGSAEPTERDLWARIGQRVAPAPGRLGRDRPHPRAGGAGDARAGRERPAGKDSFRTKPESVNGEEVLARHFPAGAGNPVQVVGRAEAADRSAPRAGGGGSGRHPTGGQGRLCVPGGTRPAAPTARPPTT